MIVLFGLIMAGCVYGPAKVTGGGFIDPVQNATKANFGFNVDGCEAYEICDGVWGNIGGHFNYLDRETNYVSRRGEKGGVKMNGEVVGAFECLKAREECRRCYQDDDGVEASYMFEVHYRSTNPFWGKGETGTAVVCAIDFGEGANALHPDFMTIKVESGPYARYRNHGPIQGNIQAHPCEDEI